MSGKGSKPRPMQISREEYERRYAAIFQASEAAKFDRYRPELDTPDYGPIAAMTNPVTDEQGAKEGATEEAWPGQ